ncbi:MAG: hypothetical protein IK143_02440 [Bacteroidales bacterium]|nr:hypothetical protein [Bacteroidales bacterium]
MLKKLVILATSVACLTACDALSSLTNAVGDFVHRDAVAKAGKHKLYRTEVEEAIPDGLSSEDSLIFATRYINAWAADKIFLDVAESKLSKTERDVSKELEDYRISLLKYRYGQLYINERLDTVITPQEIALYYESHKDKFQLDVPILKTRYIHIAKDSPNYTTIRRKMSSSVVEDVIEADAIAYTSALRYIDSSDTWIDAVSLAREFGVDYVTMLSQMKQSFIEIPDDYGNVHCAYVVDIIREGHLAPQEYCTERIKDIILSTRKHALISTLEQELLEDARTKDKFVIY